MSLAETCSVPWLITCVWMLDFRWEQKNIVLLLLLCYSMHSHSTCVSFVMSMAPNRTGVSQCLQELISFLNTITGSCVLDFSSGGFLKDFFCLLPLKKTKVTFFLGFRLTGCDAASTISGHIILF